ncbi:MAG: hypothetical protein IPM54_24010 [Polyangiaceae bacterium]|nr:hypothetical protein [Polyangiaceae bacterium]
MPDISDVPGAWEAGKDPYADYADAVIASLKDYVSGGVVIGRASFVAEVRAWRSNQAALEKAIKARMSVSQAEVNAFLNAQNKVTSYLQQFMNGSGWFHDAPIPQDVRADIDGTLKNLYGELAEELKDRLNEWEASQNPPEANLFFDTLRAFSAGMQAGDELAEQYRETMRTIVHGASRVAIGFVPFAGPALDICEAVTGKEWCLPSGRKLSDGERILSGVGFGVGKLVKIWKGVKTAAISGEGKAVAAGIVALDDIAEMMARAKGKVYKSPIGGELIGAVTKNIDKIGDFEKLAARRLVNQEGHQMLAFGDDAVRNVVGIAEGGSMAGVNVACDFITIAKNDMLALSEVKGIIDGKVDVEHAVLQLKNVAKALNGKKLADGKTFAHTVERVQIFVPKGSASKFNGTYKRDGTNLLDTSTNKFVTLKNQGRADLIVQVVEL